MGTRGGRHAYLRTDRVAEQIRRELAELIRFGVKDPRLAKLLQLVTITDVEVSPDYSHAMVFYTSMTDESLNENLAEGLAKIAGSLRSELGRRIRLHQVPALHFKFDASVSYGANLSKLIDDTIAADKSAQFDRKDDARS